MFALRETARVLMIAALMALRTVTEQDTGKQIELSAGDRLRVELDETPTTGYRWALETPTTGQFTLENSDFSAPKAVGGSGVRAFTFRFNAQGTYPIKLKLWREWEGEKSVIKRFECTAAVRSTATSRP